MANLKKYILAWGLPTDVDVTSVRVRASETAPSADPEDPATYAIPFDDVGKVTQCTLPLPKTPLIDGTLYIGVSVVDDVGNESDISWVNFPFDLVAPSAVTDLRLL